MPVLSEMSGNHIVSGELVSGELVSGELVSGELVSGEYDVNNLVVMSSS